MRDRESAPVDVALAAPSAPAAMERHSILSGRASMDEGGSSYPAGPSEPVSLHETEMHRADDSGEGAFNCKQPCFCGFVRPCNFAI